MTAADEEALRVAAAQREALMGLLVDITVVTVPSETVRTA